ncbi:hypothetical protein [Actinotalea fermentans]|uniref:Uncharacterized protein n=1 Tax=Actinotalea fermentans TaxID=43671 RepID=A0A511YVJ7_9CELL|nr:hypothetical protein [Actinotalea fermentans]KGM16679.1 hypothetical protein N867_17190 [Actinotalea fermentans ATCC 43279 = JCM 9966 = DSM 3133]GEN79217.1 hypothetical protein AFE02nite_09510 [Actinotalea fermentans]
MGELPAAAVVLTQVAVPEALAAACALQKLAVDAVPTPIGTLAWCRDTSDGAPTVVARAVSALLPAVPVLLLTQRDGQISASRWSGGAEGEQLSPGLVLDGAPAVVEQLLLGQVSAADQPGVVTSAGMSRWRATRTLAAVSRSTRRAARGTGRATDGPSA